MLSLLNFTEVWYNTSIGSLAAALCKDYRNKVMAKNIYSDNCGGMEQGRRSQPLIVMAA